MRSKLRLDTLSGYLIPSSLFYLALPYIIFVVGWLKWYLAISCAGLIVFPLYFIIRKTIHTNREGQEQSCEIMVGGHIIILVVVVGVLFLGVSGVGGYGYQDTDWIKHNAILKDLVERPWPVIYQLGGQNLPLVYYFAYYLPAAAVGKLGGWYLASQVLFAWSLMGLVMATLWFLVLNRHITFTGIALFVLFSGLDVIGELITRWVVAPIRPEVMSILKWDHIEQWSIGWQYSSNATLLFWVPHQALAGWIATGVFLYNMLNSRQEKYGFFIVGLTALWSPFVTIGLLPYVLADFLLEAGSLPARIRSHFSWPDLCGLGLLAIAGLYYSAKFVTISPWLSGSIPQGFSLSFTADTGAKVIGFALIIVFCLLEFGLYSFFIIRATRKWDTKARGAFITTLVCLSLMPFYRFGGVNDFVMRASIPALFVLAVFLGRTLFGHSLTGIKRIVLIALVSLGSVTALIEFHRHISGIYDAGTHMQTPPVSQVMSIDHWGVTTDKDVTIMLQYVGGLQAPFFEFMVKEH